MHSLQYHEKLLINADSSIVFKAIVDELLSPLRIASEKYPEWGSIPDDLIEGQTISLPVKGVWKFTVLELKRPHHLVWETQIDRTITTQSYDIVEINEGVELTSRVEERLPFYIFLIAKVMQFLRVNPTRNQLQRIKSSSELPAS